MMKRFLASALVLSSISGFGLVGCADKASEEVKVTTPTGTTTETKEIKTTEPGGLPGGSPAASPAK